jgi:hypothetical protein
VSTLKCPGCGLTRPFSDYLTRTGPDARKLKREGQHYGRCVDCRRTVLSTPRKFLLALVTKAKLRRAFAGPKTITIDHLMHVLRLQSGICPLTGLTLTFARGSGTVFTNASLDRIDQSQGYVQGNVRLVTLWANLARNSLSDEDFHYFCNLVAARHRKHQR